MPRQKNIVALATGKLILAIEQECGDALNEPASSQAHQVRSRAHLLQQAAQGGFVPTLLAGSTVVEYLGKGWLSEHPSMAPSVNGLLAAISEQKT